MAYEERGNGSFPSNADGWYQCANVKIGGCNSAGECYSCYYSKLTYTDNPAFLSPFAFRPEALINYQS